MADHIITSRIKWLLDYELDGERVRLRCIDSLRDTPIEFTIRTDELASLTEFLERFVREHPADFADIDITAVDRT